MTTNCALCHFCGTCGIHRKTEWVDVLPKDVKKSANVLIGDLIMAAIAGLTIAYVVALYIRHV